MKTTFTNSSRRRFLERLAITSTVLVASPTILLANNSSKLLRFAILGEDSSLRNVIEKSDRMMIVEDLKLATVIYVSNLHPKNKDYVQEISNSDKPLIIENHESTGLLIEHCKNLDRLLVIVERSKDDSKLFERADYYENNYLQISDFQKVNELIVFLGQHTKPLKFNIKSEHKPAEMLIS